MAGSRNKLQRVSDFNRGFIAVFGGKVGFQQAGSSLS
jgi:hypothetical protein